MEDKIFDIVTDLVRGDISKEQAISQLLVLYSVSCQCDACKQDRIDSNYRKYIELNKNVIGYD
jgi:hypothetical protein